MLNFMLVIMNHNFKQYTEGCLFYPTSSSRLGMVRELRIRSGREGQKNTSFLYLVVYLWN